MSKNSVVIQLACATNLDMENDSSLPPDSVKSPFMVSFDFAQDRLAHHERNSFV